MAYPISPLIALILLSHPLTSSNGFTATTYATNSLDDPNFIPGENMGTGHGEPKLTPPQLPAEILRTYAEQIKQIWETSVSTISALAFVTLLATLAVVATCFNAIEFTIRIQSMIEEHRDDTEMIAAYLARNKTAYAKAAAKEKLSMTKEEVVNDSEDE